MILNFILTLICCYTINFVELKLLLRLIVECLSEETITVYLSLIAFWDIFFNVFHSYLGSFPFQLEWNISWIYRLRFKFGYYSTFFDFYRISKSKSFINWHFITHWSTETSIFQKPLTVVSIISFSQKKKV